MRFIRVSSLILSLGAILLLPSCKDGVPSSREINAYHLDEFIIDQSDLSGVYVNYDVDSLILTYATSSDDFWKTLESRLADTEWKQIEQANAFRRYERVLPDLGSLGSSEELRIAHKSGHDLVVVAWVQADAKGSFAETQEGDWAEGMIWPKFKSLID